MKPLWCPHPNAGLIWDVTADVVLELDIDGILLLAGRILQQNDRPPTESYEGILRVIG